MELKEIENKIDRLDYDLTDKNIVIFGAGNTSLLNKDVLLNEGLNIKYFCDNDPKRINKNFLGYQVISFEQLLSIDNLFVITCAGTANARVQIQEQLNRYNIKNCTLYKYILGKYKEELLQAYQLMSEKRDKEIFKTIINSRIENRRYPIDICTLSGNQYFDNNNINYYYNLNNFVDLGAYVGDTIEDYVNFQTGVFNKIYAFEPDKSNYQSMIQRVQRLKNEWHLKDEMFALENAGIDKMSSIKMFQNPDDITNNGLSAQFVESENGILIPTFSIDDYFKKNEISFLKADIESYETKMLEGAKKVIKRDNPALAICAYHTAKDIFEIPLLIHQIEKDYNFNLRHYSNNEAETIVYAYTKKRK